MSFTARDVKDLREKTGCGMMDCKNALSHSNGDMDAAIDFLREKGLAAASKKSSRIAAEGVAYSCVNDEGNIGALIEVNSETDFVAKNAEFQNFVKICALTVMKENPSDVDELLKCKAFLEDKTVETLLREKVLTIGENIKIRRFKRFEGTLSSYIHAGGRIAVMVKFDVTGNATNKNEFKEYAKDIAMQVAAVNPIYLNKESVPSHVLEHERKILFEQISNDGKPANVVEKIVAGRLQKFLKEVCLVEQVFVKDPSLSINDYTKTVSDGLSAKIKIVDFARFEKGEGIEKREDNFADEVASMIK